MSKERLVFFDTETISFPEDNPNEDILCQLAFMDTLNRKTYCDYMKPELYKKMTARAMSVNKITPELLEDKPTKENTDAWSTLKDILENTEDKVFLIAHNIKFDLEVIKQSGIKPNKNVLIIDTMIVAEFINDNNNLIFDMVNLQYLKYHYRLDLKRPALDKMLGIDTSKLDAHDALPDVLDLFLVYKEFIKLYDGDTFTFNELTTEPFVLNLLPFGKDKGNKFTSLNHNQLKYYAGLDGNVAHTAKVLLS